MPKEKLYDSESVLEKLMDLFWRKGYHATSIADMVKVTGLSRSSLYAEYPDKHKLFMAALLFYQKQESEKLQMEIKKVSTAKAKVEKIFKAVLKNIMDDSYGKGCFMINTSSEMANQNREISSFTKNDFEGMQNLFLGIIKDGIAAGEIKSTHKPRSLAAYLFNGYLGIRILGQNNPDKNKLEDVIKVILEVL